MKEKGVIKLPGVSDGTEVCREFGVWFGIRCVYR